MSQTEILKQVELLAKAIENIEDLDSKVNLLNEVKKKFHSVSPFKLEPTDCVIWVKNEKVEANNYNPNSVAPPEMKLLQLSIQSDGYTQPIVTWMDDGRREVIDGYHRNRVGKEVEEVKQRVHGYLPVVTANGERTGHNDRVAATIRHNRARGKHSIDGMAEIVLALKRRNWSQKKIGKELGMDPDEVLRLSQITGLAEMFKDSDFTEAWEAEWKSIEDASDVIQEGIED